MNARHARSDIKFVLNGKVCNSYHLEAKTTKAQCAARHREMIATNYPAARILYQVATIVPANKE